MTGPLKIGVCVAVVLLDDVVVDRDSSGSEVVVNVDVDVFVSELSAASTGAFLYVVSSESMVHGPESRSSVVVAVAGGVDDARAVSVAPGVVDVFLTSRSAWWQCYKTFFVVDNEVK